MNTAPSVHLAGMEKKDVKLQLVVPQSLIDRLDDWRVKRKMWSRADAVRQAIEKMIAEDDKP